MSSDDYIANLLTPANGYGALDDEMSVLRREAMAYFGRAIYRCQVIEQSLIIILTASSIIARQHGWSDFPYFNRDLSDVKQILSKKSLGKLLNEIRKQKRVSISLRVLDDLGDFIRKRNFFAHEYFYERDPKMHSKKGLIEIVKECDEFWEEYESLEVACDLLESLLLEFAGMDRAMVEQKSKELLEEHRQYGESADRH